MAKSTQELLDDVLGLIRQLASDGDLPKALVNAPIGANTAIDDLGMDSVAKASLLTAIDESLGIFIPDDKISGEMTLGALADQVGRAQQG
jgi:acyl carrier protein